MDNLIVGMDGHIPIGGRTPWHDTYETEKAPLGTRKFLSDGSVFKFMRNGATALDNNVLLQNADSADDHAVNLAVAAAAVGTKSVTVTNGATTAITANMYKGGKLQVNDAGAATTTEGYEYYIDSHPAAATGATCVITLRDELQIALTTASQVALIKSPYDAVIVNPTTATGYPVGVSRVVVAASYYFWCQTWGPVSCLIAGTPAIGTGLTYGTTAGALNIMATDGQIAPIAIIQETGVSGEYKEVWLMISP